MLSNIDHTIEALQKEANHLKGQMERYIQAGFLLEAHHFQKAYFNANRKLITIQKLVNPNYERQRRLEQLEKLDYESYKLGKLKFYKSKELSEEEIKKHFDNLREFKRKSINKNYPEQHQRHYEDQQILDETIFELLENRVSSFKLHLDVNNSLFINFCKKENTLLEISFISLTQSKDYAIYSEKIKGQLLGLGFHFDEVDQSMKRNFEIEKIKDAIEIKTLLSRIIYDVLYKNLRREQAFFLEVFENE